jgi:hypothetical protein
MIKFSFVLPTWLHWLVPNREDDERRAAVTGAASRSYLFGMITIWTKII